MGWCTVYVGMYPLFEFRGLRFEVGVFVVNDTVYLVFFLDPPLLSWGT